MANIESMLVLSTSHLSEPTAAMLDNDPRLPDGSFQCSAGGPWPFGYFMYADGTDDEALPADLRQCFKYARDRNVHYILFDRDAAAVDDLPQYEW